MRNSDWATYSILCCLEISSGKWIGPFPLNLDLVKFLGHGQKAAIWLAKVSQEWLIFQLIIVLLTETLTWAYPVLNALSTTFYQASTRNPFRQLWHMLLMTALRRQRQWIFRSLKASWSREWVPGQPGLYSEAMPQKTNKRMPWPFCIYYSTALSVSLEQSKLLPHKSIGFAAKEITVYLEAKHEGPCPRNMDLGYHIGLR